MLKYISSVSIISKIEYYLRPGLAKRLDDEFRSVNRQEQLFFLLNIDLIKKVYKEKQIRKWKRFHCKVSQPLLYDINQLNSLKSLFQNFNLVIINVHK